MRSYHKAPLIAGALVLPGQGMWPGAHKRLSPGSRREPQASSLSWQGDRWLLGHVSLMFPSSAVGLSIVNHQHNWDGKPNFDEVPLGNGWKPAQFGSKIGDCWGVGFWWHPHFCWFVINKQERERGTNPQWKRVQLQIKRQQFSAVFLKGLSLGLYTTCMAVCGFNPDSDTGTTQFCSFFVLLRATRGASGHPGPKWQQWPVSASQGKKRGSTDSVLRRKSHFLQTGDCREKLAYMVNMCVSSIYSGIDQYSEWICDSTCFPCRVRLWRWTCIDI